MKESETNRNESEREVVDQSCNTSKSEEKIFQAQEQSAANPSKMSTMSELQALILPTSLAEKADSKSSFISGVLFILGVLALGALLKYLSSIFIPLVLAILMGIILTPIVVFLTKHRCPTIVAVLGAQILATLVVGLIVTVFVISAGPVSKAIPKYQKELTHKAQVVTANLLERVGDEEKRQELKELLMTEALPQVISKGASMLQKSAQTATSVIGYLALTWLFSLFVLLESSRLQEKFAEALGSGHPLLDVLGAISHDVRAYMIAKTFTGLLTSLVIWGFLAICGVDFSLFWGLLAFPLNFIPTVGAIIAMVPPILCSIVDPSQTMVNVIIVGCGLGVVNAVIGSFVEPKFVGQAVKLSALVVVLSMMIWGVIWGPAGMILGVPIMVGVKLVCAHIRGLETIAIMMKG